MNYENEIEKFERENGLNYTLYTFEQLTTLIYLYQRLPFVDTDQQLKKHATIERLEGIRNFLFGSINVELNNNKASLYIQF